MNALHDSILELIRRTSAEIPDDVQAAILNALKQEKAGTIAASAMKIVERNIELAKQKSQPICQDTGSIIFYVDCPVGFDQIAFEEQAQTAVRLATKKGYLRQNSVDSLTGVNDGTNVGPGTPTIHFHQHRDSKVNVRLILKEIATWRAAGGRSWTRCCKRRARDAGRGSWASASEGIAPPATNSPSNNSCAR